jgi:hypothetical protein
MGSLSDQQVTANLEHHYLRTFIVDRVIRDFDNVIDELTMINQQESIVTSVSST